MVTYKLLKYAIFSIVIGLICLNPSPSRAADYSDGDACSASGALHTTNDTNGVDVLVCDGANWQAAISYFSAGGLSISSLTGQPAPTVTGSIANLSDLADVNEPSPTDGECLTYVDAASEWQGGTCGSGGGTPGGSDTQIQFNDGGSTLGGDADFVWNKTSNKLTVTGEIDYTGVITDTSDRRLKDNIVPLENALEGLMALQAYAFTMKGDESGTVEYGLMAQDVQPVFPELVKTKADGMMSLNYVGLIAPVIEAIKMQQALIETQHQTINGLTERLEALEASSQTGDSTDRQDEGP